MYNLYARARRIKQELYQFISISSLKVSGAHIQNDVKIFGSFTFVGPGENIYIGTGSSINEGVFLNARDKLSIGKCVHLSPYVQLHTGGLQVDSFKREHNKAPIVIEDNVWVASGAVITKGVKIGRYSVVGANSVVTKDVPECSVVAGNPAKFIRNVVFSKEGLRV